MLIVVFILIFTQIDNFQALIDGIYEVLNQKLVQACQTPQLQMLPIEKW